MSRGVSKIERGQQRVDFLELVTIARTVNHPLEWFLSSAAPVLASHRGDLRERQEINAWAALAALEQDVGLLTKLHVLQPPGDPYRPRIRVQEPGHAEQVACEARNWLGEERRPFRDLARIVERFGLFCVSLGLGAEGPEGCHRALDGHGVALTNGDAQPGRRRFTLVHELGHHIFADPYSMDWHVFGKEESERVINAFAIHFLVPRAGVLPRWKTLQDQGLNERVTAIMIAAEYGVSWSAVCPQLLRLGLLDKDKLVELEEQPPRVVDFEELSVGPPKDLSPPNVSPQLTAAIIKAFKKHKIGAGRAVEMLRGTQREDELPPRDKLPQEAWLDELEPL